MPTWSKYDLMNYERKRANQAGVAGIHSGDSESVKRRTLECRVSREEKGGTRLEVCFTMHSLRPCDWDGYHIKPILDMLVHAGLLPGDAWHQLEGCIRSRKVHTKEEEKTIIEITPL